MDYNSKISSDTNIIVKNPKITRYKGEKRYPSEDFRASDAGGNLKLSKIL